METITLKQQKEFRKAYEENISGKNHGTWNMSNMPELPVGYRLMQYENDNKQICDVIKFSEPVHLENHRHSNQAYCLSKHKPNHQVGEWWREIPEVTVRTCKSCGNVYPVNSDMWASTRKCINCSESLESRFDVWLENYVKTDNASLGWAKHIALYNFGILEPDYVTQKWNEIEEA